MARYANIVDGTEIEMDILRHDFAGDAMFEDCDNLTDSLVMFADDGRVVVDTRASDEYALWAATHEMICCGPYKHLAPKTDQECCRCGEIDLMLLNIMPKELRQEYRGKRLEMFRVLIDMNLNESLEESFKHSIEALSV